MLFDFLDPHRIEANYGRLLIEGVQHHRRRRPTSNQRRPKENNILQNIRKMRFHEPWVQIQVKFLEGK